MARRTKVENDARDGEIVARVVAWFAREARELPWRSPTRDPWVSLVSEAMLQQTQVARVLEKFGPFVRRFPTPAALASADEQQVLAAWSGLGYYRRARSLQGAARAIVAEHGGATPREPEALMRLPGVGRYTAGAIASIVFGERAAIVDGNVARVLLRVEGRPGALNEKRSMDWAWRRSGELAAIAHARGRIGAFNEGLMELGATVCTPATPRCDACPLRGLCVAAREGLQKRIPAPRPRAARAQLHHACLVVRDASGRTLVQRRPARGLWAGLWQPPTIESVFAPASATDVRRLARTFGARTARHERSFRFQTTHREVCFDVWQARVVEPTGEDPVDARWAEATEIRVLPLSNAHRRILVQAVPVATAKRTARERSKSGRGRHGISSV